MEGRRREGRTRRRRRGEGKGKGDGEGRKKGEVGGMAQWLLGDRRPCPEVQQVKFTIAVI